MKGEAMTIADWQPFFAAQLGAAATLGGLVFVGLSLNLKTILSYPALPDRAFAALWVLLAIMIISSFVLIPGQSLPTLAMEILACGAPVTIICTTLEIKTLRKVEAQDRPLFLRNLFMLELGVLPYVIGGGLMLLGDAIGLYFVAAAMILSIIKIVLEAWVLLVEVKR
jgi:hypothetical protein